MASVLQWLFGVGHYAQCTSSPEEVNFFSKLDFKDHAEQRYAILDVINHFKGEELSKVVRRLQAQYRCNINAKDNQERSALHILADKISQSPGSVDATLENLYNLLEANINPDLQDADKNTLLHLLARQMGDLMPYVNIHDYLSFIQYLVETKGADLTIKNKFGNTALHELVQYGDDLIIEATPNKPAINAVQFFIQLARASHCFYTIKRFRNIDGNSLLHLAAFHGQAQTVQLLLDLEWNSRCKNKDGVTPLHYAVLGKTTGHLHIVEALLATGKIDISMPVHTLGYTVPDIVQSLVEYVQHLNENSDQTSNEICSIIYSKLPTTHSNIPPINDDVLDIEQKIKKINQHVYYTASQRKHCPQLYIQDLNTRSEMMSSYYYSTENAMESWSIFHTYKFNETSSRSRLVK